MLPLVGDQLPLVGDLIPLVGDLIPLVGDLIPLVGDRFASRHFGLAAGQRLLALFLLVGDHEDH